MLRSFVKEKKHDNIECEPECWTECWTGKGRCKEVSLDMLQKGEEAVIASVPEMSLLPPLGFRPGKKVCIQAKGCFGGPIFAEIEKRSVALGRRLAEEVKVVLPEAEEGEHGKTA